MYLKENKIKLLRIINIIINIIVAVGVACSVIYLLDLISFYGFDMFTLTRAASFKSSIIWIVTGLVILPLCSYFRYMVSEVYFYNSYFEGDLDGYIAYYDLAEITGDNENKIKRKVRKYRSLFMKGFSIDNQSKKQIVLDSKKAVCQCLKCGAEIEKRMFFVGTCEYCQSSDLTAKVLMQDRIYQIRKEERKKKVEDYLCKRFQLRCIMQATVLALLLFVALILFFMSMDYIEKYNNEEYFKEILRNALRTGDTSRPYTKDLIQKEMKSQLIFNAGMLVLFTGFIVGVFARLRSFSVSKYCANIFARAKTAFLTIGNLYFVRNEKEETKRMQGIKFAICSGHLRGCSFEKYEGTMHITLQREIIKDTCPNCGASITDPVFENYRCKFCSSLIMDVIKKK